MRIPPVRNIARTIAAAASFILLSAATPLLAQCPEEPPLQNYNGGGAVACPCFVAGEEAGVILNAPLSHYPLEILRIRVGWGSVFNSNFPKVEEALRVYGAGLPNPGAPIFELIGPQLIDGAINEYNIEPLPGEVTVTGPFTVSLKFFDSNAGVVTASSVVHDGNGCQPGKNAVFVIPGGWFDACLLGVTGDWVFQVIYRPCTPTATGDGPYTISSSPALLMSAAPNPFEFATEFDLYLAEAGPATVTVYDVKGRRVAEVADRTFPSGISQVTWDGHDSQSQRLPSGVYFVELRAGKHRSVKKVTLTR